MACASPATLNSELKTQNSAQVVGVGCAALDYLAIVPGMPQFDDAASVKPSEWLISGGGPVATALVTLARLGIPVAYLGVLGDEMVGHEIRRQLALEGVDVGTVRLEPGVRSTTSLVLVEAATGRRAFISFEGGRRGFELGLPERQAIEQARILHLDGWYPEAALPAARIARKAGVLVSWDAYLVRPGTDEWISLCDVLISNESFPREYTGSDDLKTAADVLLGQGPRLVVATLGERGCFVATRERGFTMPGYAVEVKDSTGAGDAFHGAFLYGLLHDWDLADVARFANAVGALTCRRLGGRSGAGSLGEVELLLRDAQQPLALPA